MDNISCLDNLKKGIPFLWINKGKGSPDEEVSGSTGINAGAMYEAGGILDAYAPVLKKLFPELEESGGIIESPLIPAENILEELGRGGSSVKKGRLLIKGDHALPVSGSIKARGGIYAVLRIVDSVAVKEGIFNPDRTFSLSGKSREVFSRYTVAVGSTGNLGLSIGIAGRAFGFKVEVHMSSDARSWKKELLGRIGAEVIEHDGDYSAACAAARSIAEKSETTVFIDDENSRDLFYGYSVAALRLKDQLDMAGISVSGKNPLFVYLPCGVGGAPGGITFGLKYLFGDSVHCFFAEPAQAPAMTLGLVTGKYSGISIEDIGLTGKTCADGLAVGRPSEFVSRLMSRILDGAYTVQEDDFYGFSGMLYDLEGIKIELSAAAGLAGAAAFIKGDMGADYISDLDADSGDITHLVWTTGGSMEPKSDFMRNYALYTGKP